MNKRQLISLIEQTRAFEKGAARLELEQYTTDAIAAVEMAFIAGFMHDDLHGRIVFDLGAGTGRLGLCALFLGAARVVAIELDQGAIALCYENMDLLDMEDKVDVVNADVLKLPIRDSYTIKGNEGIVLMNPPFGVHNKGADVRFLLAAMTIPCVEVIYSYHMKNEKNRVFLRQEIEKAGWVITELHQTRMFIPYLYDFHDKKRKEIEVDLYRLIPQDR